MMRLFADEGAQFGDEFSELLAAYGIRELFFEFGFKAQIIFELMALAFNTAKRLYKGVK